jgi:hypothetical protein
MTQIDAIWFAIDQIETIRDGADEEYLQSSKQALDSLYCLARTLQARRVKRRNSRLVEKMLNDIS